MRPRILTFNFHEPYLSLMAKTGLPMDVGLYESGPMARPWHSFYRAIPPNLTLVPEKEWRARLGMDHYQVLIAHNEMNALDVFRARCARLLVCHNRRTFLSTSVTIDVGDPVQKFNDLLEKLRHLFSFVFISESKRADYALPGRVILPGIDLDEWGGYTGEHPCVLRVGNMMRARNLMFDVDFQEAVTADLPQRIVGLNPDIPGSTPAESFEELRTHYQTDRCYLNVTREAYEDGYNLAMLEAMACGMPVVSLANATSPLTQGVDGYLSEDAATLRRHLQDLLADRDLALALGAKGRETVTTRFPLERFVQQWRDAIQEAADTLPAGGERRPAPKRRQILMEYVCSPFTTARYFERAAREVHHVVTAGYRLPESVLRLWGFEETPPEYGPQEIDLPYTAPYQLLISRLPKDFRPDFLLWIDSGQEDIPPDIHTLALPKIACFIDTHIRTDLRIEMAKKFDAVFLAQSAQLQQFKDAGIERVYWLPLACDPPLHDLGMQERVHDVAYVGSLSPSEGDRRRMLMDEVRRHFPRHWIGKAWPAEMARIYAQSKIVVNACHNRDVNMRVFEAMASGALLITDEAEGLEDLFQDGVHLVVFHKDEDLIGLCEYYLAHDAERDRIAQAGQALVLREHTYRKRLDTLVAQVEKLMPELQEGAPPPPKIKAYYQNVRREVMERVPRLAQRVLDVGCGAGALGSTLKTERGVREVVGVEIIEAAYREALGVLDQVFFGSIEELELPFPDGYFDCIICADVLEHLVEPEAALRKLARVLAREGVLLISIPNIRYHEIIGMLSQGGWFYLDAGIMDSTHLRFFTRESLGHFVAAGGLEVLSIESLNKVPPYHAPRDTDGSLRMGKVTLSNVSDEEHADLLTIQFAVQAGHPGVDRLARARAALAEKDYEAAISLAVDAVGVDEAARLSLLGTAFGHIEQLEKSEYFFREALARRNDPAIAGELGILLVASGKPSQALPYLERARAEAPPNDRIHGALGLAYLALGRVPDAFNHLNEALRASFDAPALLKHLRDAGEPLGRLSEVEEVYRSFLDFYLGDLELVCDYAVLLKKLGRIDEARDRLNFVLLFAPGHPRAARLLGELPDA